MYVPPHFAETDREKLFDFIERHSFGLLVNQLDGAPFASHLPLLVDRRAGGLGRLIGHMARANRQWTAAGDEVLVVFSGPHAYISPAWYEAQRVVPTWNYLAVHAYGTMQVVDDAAAVLEIVRDFVAFYERGRPQPWQLDGPEEWLARMVDQIVGFTIDLTRLEGKWKLSQNHPRERREKVVAALELHGDENSRAIAERMRETLRG